MLATAKTASPKTQKCLKPHGTSGFRHYGANGHCIKDGVNIDPACGSGGMFVQAARYMHRHNADSKEMMNFRCYGVEKEPDTVKLAKMNLLLNNVRGETVVRQLCLGI